jgi:hypothetical protein
MELVGLIKLIQVQELGLLQGFETYSTGSSYSVVGGGTWYTGSSLGLNVVQSKVYNYTSDKDLNVDVTNTILTWYSASNSLGGLINDGFIVKQSNNDEFVADKLYKQAKIQFYSIDTNTIYPPELQFQWDDFSFILLLLLILLLILPKW